MDVTQTPLLPFDSLLLEALLRTDPGCWCYIPLDPSALLRCSEGFRRLWRIGTLVESAGAQSGSSENRSWLAQSLTHFGIKPCQFFDLVANSPMESPTGEPVVLVRNDQRRIQLSMQPIEYQHLVRGHIVRMKDCSHDSILNAIVEEVERAKERLAVLSVREAEILDLVYEGRTNKAISISTTISEKTVEKHRARIMQKLGLLSTAELLRLVTKARLMDEVSALLDKHSAASVAAGLYTDGRLRESA